MIFNAVSDVTALGEIHLGFSRFIGSCSTYRKHWQTQQI